MRSPVISPRTRCMELWCAAACDKARCAAAQVWDMHALLKQGMDSGEVAPLPWTVYGRDQCQDAFRFLASGALPAL